MRKSPDNRRAMPFEQWPERDRQAWLEANAPGDDDLLGVDRPALRWRGSSTEVYVRYYGIWLACLADRNLLDPNAAPGERATRAHLTAFLRAQRALGNSAKTLVNQAASLKSMFEVLDPSQDWTWMLPMISKLKTAIKRGKNHSDLPTIKELLDLGMLLMRRAECEEAGSPKQRAVMYRNGLSIAVLAARPFMRRRNLAAMKIGEHIVKDGSVYRLQFSGEEMKGRRRRGGPLPMVLTARIDRYLDVHRPVLFIGKPDVEGTLFISCMGLPIYPHAMSNEIGRVTDAFFGRRICTHEFRHATGSSIAKEDPEHVGIVPDVLGHADYRTSENYYIFADEYAAFQRLDRALEKLARSQEGPDAR